jgi:hypothetical protein
MKFGKHLSRGGRILAPFTNLGSDEVWSGNRTWAAVGSNWSHSKVSDQKASYRHDFSGLGILNSRGKHYNIAHSNETSPLKGAARYASCTPLVERKSLHEVVPFAFFCGPRAGNLQATPPELD